MTTTLTKQRSTTHCQHPDPNKAGVNIDTRKYAAMREALLTHIPRRATGVPFGELQDAVTPLLPRDVFADASIPWYLVTVKLDLEARGLIERVPSVRPQHLRRPRGRAS